MQNSIFLTLIPIFFIIFLGYFLKDRKILQKNCTNNLENLLFYAFLPALLFVKTVTVDIDNIISYAPVVSATLIPPLVILIVSLISFRQLKITHVHSYTAVLQGMISGNWTLIGLPIALVLFKGDVLTNYYILIAASNIVLTIPMLTIITRVNAVNSKHSVKTVIEILTNPVLISIILGLTINLTGIIKVPNFVLDSLEMIGQPTAVIGMILVGSNLEIKNMFKYKRDIFISSSIRLMLMPLFTVFLCNTFEVSKSATIAAVLLNSISVAMSSFIYEAELKGNPKLMSKIITFQTFASAITIPLIIQYLVK